jgi:hypothetical protein
MIDYLHKKRNHESINFNLENLEKSKKRRTEFEMTEIQMYNCIRDELSSLKLDPSDDIIISEVLYSVQKKSTHDSISRNIIKQAIENEKIFLKIEPNQVPHNMNGIILYNNMKEMKDRFRLKMIAWYLLETNRDSMEMEDSYEYFLQKLNREYSMNLD